MQWEKLERNFQALETILRTLGPQDKINLLLFNTEIAPFRPAPVSAEMANVNAAIDFLKASRLRGGPDLLKALRSGIAEAATNSFLVLLSDGGATRGTINSGKLSTAYAKAWSALPEIQRPKTYIFAVGDDASLPLLRLLARNDGVLENVLSTE